jgi:hypothetical protein
MSGLDFLPFRGVLRQIEEFGRAKGTVGDGLEGICADRTTRPSAIDASEILDGTKHRRSTLTCLSAHVWPPMADEVVGRQNCKSYAPS